MVDLLGLKIGVALCGSFCTFEKAISQISQMILQGANVFPIMSFNSATMDTRFGRAEDFKKRLVEITNNKIIDTIQLAEEVGPKDMFDILVMMPCTGNTLAKIANGITDTPAVMACKAHLRNGKPVVISIATNDGLGLNMKNIGIVMSTKNIYFVPFEQDDCKKKPNSIIAKLDMVIPTIYEAMERRQIQPVI